MKSLLTTAQKGFTLIELLIVIAIIGILSGVVLVAIDPVNNLNAANDTKVQRDVSTLAQSMDSYALDNSGTYPAVQSSLIPNYIKQALTAPGGYSAYGMAVSNNTSATVWGQIKAKKNGTNTFFVWCSASGKAAAQASTTACP